MGLVPVNLCLMDCPVHEAHSCDALPLSPAALTMLAAQAPELADRRPGRDRLDAADGADDLEIHRLNLAFRATDLRIAYSANVGGQPYPASRVYYRATRPPDGWSTRLNGSTAVERWRQAVARGASSPRRRRSPRAGRLGEGSGTDTDALARTCGGGG